MKKLFTFFILTVLIVSGMSSAGLTLTNTIAQVETKITTFLNSDLVWLQKYGPINGFYDFRLYDGKERYLRATYDIGLTDNGQHIYNVFSSNQYRAGTCKYFFNYDSAITFQATDNGTGQEAIIVTDGDLYLNGAKLDREIDGSYIVPTSQNLIATFSVHRQDLASMGTNPIAYTSNAPIATNRQDIYLQGYVPDIPAVPEPSTIAMLTIGSLLTFYKRRIA